MLRTETITDRLVPVTELRRNFDAATRDLTRVESLILTRRGEPFATLTALPSEKRKLLRRAAGAWAGTKLDNDKIWHEVAKRKSRGTSVTL